MDEKKEIGLKVLALKAKKKISYLEIVKGTGLPATTLNRIVNGTGRLSLAHAVKIKDFFDLSSAEDLLLPRKEFAKKYDLSTVTIEKIVKTVSFLEA